MDRYVDRIIAQSEVRDREEGAFNNLLENIIIIMEAGNMSLEGAMKFLRIPEEKQPKIREALANMDKKG